MTSSHCVITEYVCLVIVAKTLEEAKEAEEEQVVEEVEVVQEEIPAQLEPETVAPQFIQVFDDVVSSLLTFARFGRFLVSSFNLGFTIS